MMYFPIRNTKYRKILFQNLICPDCGRSVGSSPCCEKRAVPITDSTLCPKCKIALVPGHAIENTLTGFPDFPGDPYPVTVSPGGPGKLIACMKCAVCGYSRTITKADQQ